MIKKIALLAAGTVLAAGSAQAGFITGSIAFTDGFDPAGIPSVPTSSIVSDLSTVDVQNGVNVYTGGSATGDLSGATSAAAFDIMPPALPTTFFTTDNGFTFTIETLTLNSSTPLSCNGAGLCNDFISFDVSGTVDGAGFDSTQFLGTWGASGSCLGSNAAGCESNIAASWNSTLVATGREVPQVPEPTSLALIGLGLAGLAFSRRRKV